MDNITITPEQQKNAILYTLLVIGIALLVFAFFSSHKPNIVEQKFKQELRKQEELQQLKPANTWRWPTAPNKQIQSPFKYYELKHHYVYYHGLWVLCHEVYNDGTFSYNDDLANFYYGYTNDIKAVSDIPMANN